MAYAMHANGEDGEDDDDAEEDEGDDNEKPVDSDVDDIDF